jgi:hypothetical protein
VPLLLLLLCCRQVLLLLLLLCCRQVLLLLLRNLLLVAQVLLLHEQCLPLLMALLGLLSLLLLLLLLLLQQLHLRMPHGMPPVQQAQLTHLLRLQAQESHVPCASAGACSGSRCARACTLRSSPARPPAPCQWLQG